MKRLMKLLKGSHLLARGQCGDCIVEHWLMANGDVLEIVCGS